MTKELPNDLAQAIRDYLNSVSLKADALKHMSELADKVEQLEKELTNANTNQRLTKRALDKYKYHEDSVRKREDALAGREAAILEREHKAAEFEQRTAVAEAKASTYHTCFELTMKNPVVTKTMFANRPVPDGSYVSSHPESETVTETIE